MINEEQKQLVWKLFEGKITQSEFLARFGRDAPNGVALALELLREAYDRKHEEGVDFGMIIAANFGFRAEQLEVLCRLAEADWHYANERVIDAIDILRDSRAIDCLYREAMRRHDYMVWNPMASAVRAMYALAKLRHPLANEKLNELANFQDPEVRKRAAEIIEMYHEDS